MSLDGGISNISILFWIFLFAVFVLILITYIIEKTTRVISKLFWSKKHDQLQNNKRKNRM